MAVILKYEIEEGGYYDVLDTDQIKPGQNYYDHVIGIEYRKPKNAEIEYEPTDEEYIECLAWYAMSGLPDDEARKWDSEYKEIALKLAASILKANPDLKEVMDKDEEWAWNLSLNHDLEEFE